MRHVDSFEIQPPAPPPNGVVRSAWSRARRASRWHRPYTAILLVLDLGAACLVNTIATASFEQAFSGFQNRPGLYYLVAYLLLPLAWVVVLWGNGAYDRRYLGLGTDEFKRVVRASVTVTASVSFVAFACSITCEADWSSAAVTSSTSCMVKNGRARRAPTRRSR